MKRTSDFALKLAEADNGRFADVIWALDVKDVCNQCSYLRPEIENQHYRCHVMGTCPAATLNPKLIAYLLERIV